MIEPKAMATDVELIYGSVEIQEASIVMTFVDAKGEAVAWPKGIPLRLDKDLVRHYLEGAPMPETPTTYRPARLAQ